jgi:hypothetical protein
MVLLPEEAKAAPLLLCKAVRTVSVTGGMITDGKVMLMATVIKVR